jgi:hypothetical protein
MSSWVWPSSVRLSINSTSKSAATFEDRARARLARDLSLWHSKLVELERFTATVGPALAERVGRDRDDPEVLLTAIVIAGLSHVRTHATYRHVRTKSSMAAIRRAVRADVVRALRLIAPALEAFDDEATAARG